MPANNFFPIVQFRIFLTFFKFPFPRAMWISAFRGIG